MKKYFVLLVFCILVTVTTVSAQTCDCENLQAQIDALTARIEMLEGNTSAAISEGEKSDASSDFETVVIGDFTLDLVKSELKKSLTGDDYIEITYLFTNNSTETASCGWKIQETAFQDGIEIKSRILMDSESTTEIRPGKSIEVKSGFTLRNLTDQVEIGYKPFLSMGDAVETRFINIQ